MHCVWNAYRAYCAYRGLSPSTQDRATYEWLRWYSGYENQYTPGAIVPFMMRAFASNNGLRLKAQYRLMTPRALAQGECGRVRVLIFMSQVLGCFGRKVEKITLAPAIYLDLGAQHASFGYNVPSGVIVAAFQFI